jgi:hypothetical protein
VISKGLDLLMEVPPRWDPEGGSIDMYYWHYGTIAMVRAASLRGQIISRKLRYKDWRNTVRTVVLRNQSKRGARAGSWEPIGVWGSEGGRVYSTAIMLLTLEATGSR